MCVCLHYAIAFAARQFNSMRPKVDMNYSPRLISISRPPKRFTTRNVKLLIIKEGAAIAYVRTYRTTHNENATAKLLYWLADFLAGQNKRTAWARSLASASSLSRNDKFNVRPNSGTLTGFVFSSLIVCEFTFFFPLLCDFPIARWFWHFFGQTVTPSVRTMYLQNGSILVVTYTAHCALPRITNTWNGSSSDTIVQSSSYPCKFTMIFVDRQRLH